MNITIRRALLLSAVSALLAAPTLTLDGQAAAQTVEELTVTGRYGPGGEPQSLSQAVSYADLDLGAEADRDEFKQRIRLTARYLCEKLGEPEATAAPAPSCRQAAERDALAKADDVFKAFRPRGPNWARGSAWVPPYSKPQR